MRRKERHDNKLINRPPGMKSTKRNKVEEDMIANVKEQVFGQGAGWVPKLFSRTVTVQGIYHLLGSKAS